MEQGINAALSPRSGNRFGSDEALELDFRARHYNLGSSGSQFLAIKDFHPGDGALSAVQTIP